jgi:hypothetical protein
MYVCVPGTGYKTIPKIAFMVFACVFVLVGLDLLNMYTHMCISCMYYSTSSRYSTYYMYLYNSMYNIYVPCGGTYCTLCVLHAHLPLPYFSFLLFSRMEKGVCQQLNFEER